MKTSDSKDPLAKKFICKYCGQAIRTRQGLSGHIQFKHSPKQQSTETDASYIMPQVAGVELFGTAWKLSKSDVKARQMILINWLEVEALFDFLDIKPNNQDFKNFMIVGLANLYANRQLKEELISDFRELLEENT